MTYVEIIELIVEKIGPFLKTGSDAKLRDWLNKLSDYDFDSQRLLICLAIDVNHELVDYNALAKYLNLTLADYLAYDNPAQAFALALKTDTSMKPRFDCLRYFDDDPASSRYAKLMSWGKFHQFVLQTLTEIDISEYTYDTFVTDIHRDFDFAAKYSAKEVFLTGFCDTAWVAPYKEVKEIIDHPPAEGVATRLCDSYGMPVNATDKNYLVLCYPYGLPVLCKQPAAVSGDWSWYEGLFLSYKQEDAFGRSYCIHSADRYMGRERIHQGIRVLYSTIEKVYLGEAKLQDKNITGLLEHGLERIS